MNFFVHSHTVYACQTLFRLNNSLVNRRRKIFPPSSNYQSVRLAMKVIVNSMDKIINIFGQLHESGKTFSFNNFLILSRFKDLSIEVEYAGFENNCFQNYNSFSRRENCELLSFLQFKCVYISIPTVTHSGILCNFSGKKITAPQV